MADTAADFRSLLFAAVPDEDRRALDPAAFESIARAAFAHFTAPRVRGIASVRVTQPPESGGTTIIEAVNDDMPFLLDSTLAELNGSGFELRLVTHPIFNVMRDDAHRLLHFSAGTDADTQGALRESFIHIHINRISDERASALQVELAAIYADVGRVVADWKPMRERIAAVIAQWRTNPPAVPADELAEAIQFILWLVADNFTFLGARNYSLREDGDLVAVEGSGLGVLRDPAVQVLRRGRDLVAATPESRAFLRDAKALIVTKANVRSRVHRRAHMDYVGIKMFTDDGSVTGEMRVVGLLTASAYHQPALSIPYLRHKVAHVIDQAHLDAHSHAGKVLRNVLETFPRDELFQIDEPTLAEFSAEIASLDDRPRVRSLVRRDRYDRFVSVLTFMPRDRYDTQVRNAVGAFLAQIFEGRVSAAYPYYPDGPLVRTQYIIGRYEGPTPVVARDVIEAGILKIIRTWRDDFDALLPGTNWAAAFPEAYQSVIAASQAAGDVAIIRHLTPQSPLHCEFVAGAAQPGSAKTAELRVYALGAPVTLSRRVPMLEQMGFSVVSETTYEIDPPEGGKVYRHDMMLSLATGDTDLASRKPLVEAALLAQFDGRADGDGYNALILSAGLGWREVAVLRGFSRYLRQIRAGFSQDYLWGALARHSETARLIADLFRLRFDPDFSGDRVSAESNVTSAILERIGAVSSLDDDRILRRFLNLVQACVRTNFFQTGTDGEPRPVIAFKFEAHRVENLPAPRPLFDTFVYGPRVEGVHLRFGKVARGGLRWSDRPQDFRTEVLGLVKAQQVKNAVIVPVGAKGGFVPANLPTDGGRDAVMAEGIACYSLFVGTLLDLTDNLVNGALVPPLRTVRHDGDDPYLVVAADKGTATFSDIANGIATAHGFWLDDAFASGGSVGYDHKAMGITARGAWEAVKRHFREIDVDIQTTPIRVIGVGDMSGDVFGNGMLLSPALKVVAAFDHRDIFIDPDPDPALSHAERARLFALPRSSWQSYDRALISKGGGIFPRSLKSIPLSPEMCALIGATTDALNPDELIRALLRAPADLLWFGGIGTYVRASTETDDMIGDRANDAVRVAASELRVKAIGEGANLALSQRGRIEAAFAGVRLNTDAIDNSAGVNTSDVEVNIKIALAAPLADGSLARDARNALLASMTDDVAHLVLHTNYRQTLAVSLAERRGASDIGFLRAMMLRLEAAGRLDRSIEFLPRDSEMRARGEKGGGLTRPEIAVVLAYAKLALHDAILPSALPDEPYFETDFIAYFPPAIEASFPAAVRGHRLRREIIATQLANELIDICGPAAVTRLEDATSADAPTIVRAFVIARDVLDVRGVMKTIDDLDLHIAGAAQLGLYASVVDVVTGTMAWVLRNLDLSGDLGAIVARYRSAAQTLSGGTEPARLAALQETGVPLAAATRIAHLATLSTVFDIASVARLTDQPVDAVATAMNAVGDLFAFDACIAAAQALVPGDYYDRLALDRALDGLRDARSRLAADVLGSTSGTPQQAFAAWVDQRGEHLLRAQKAAADLRMTGLTVSKLSLLAGLLGDLVKR